MGGVDLFLFVLVDFIPSDPSVVGVGWSIALDIGVTENETTFSDLE